MSLGRLECKIGLIDVVLHRLLALSHINCADYRFFFLHDFYVVHYVHVVRCS